MRAGARAARRRLAVAAAVLLCLVAGLSLTEATGVTNLRATVIRIFTPDGTLVVEVDDPGVKVTIEGDGGLVITGAGLQEIRLRPGSYRVQATKDGKPVGSTENWSRSPAATGRWSRVEPGSDGGTAAEGLRSRRRPRTAGPARPGQDSGPRSVSPGSRTSWWQVLGEHLGRHWG